jgi:hypothetical protein
VKRHARSGRLAFLSDRLVKTMSRFLSTTLTLTLLLGGCQRSVNDYLLQVRDPAADDETVGDAVLALGQLLPEIEASGRPFGEGERLAVEFLKDVAASKQQGFVNRMKALTALRRLKKSGDFTEVYLQALEDESWGVRLEAAKSLASSPREPAAPKLAERLFQERQPEVILEIVKALGSIGNRTALKALLEAFLDNSGRFEDTRLVIYDNVRRLSGQGHEYEARDKWAGYFEQEFPETEEPEATPSTQAAQPEGGEAAEDGGEEAPEAEKGGKP